MKLLLPCDWVVKQQLAADGSFFELTNVYGDRLTVSCHTIWRLRDNYNTDSILYGVAKELEMQNSSIITTPNGKWISSKNEIQSTEISIYGEDTAAWLSYYVNGSIASQSNLGPLLDAIWSAQYSPRK
jgi:hypothetical protein